MSAPAFFKTSLRDIDEAALRAERGDVSRLCYSAGGRDILMFQYGQRSMRRGKANYSSACGAGDPKYYSKREGPPVLLIIGGIHGSEFEGIMATLNLIAILESGRDLRGRENAFLHEAQQRCRLIVIPCLNADGRGRLAIDHMVGLTQDEMTLLAQGSWLDGTPCLWPNCKRVHPIWGEVSFLGGYFNDDGVNLMHDNFFNPMAAETASLLRLADREAPDWALLLHGGSSCPNHIPHAWYLAEAADRAVVALEARLEPLYGAAGLPFEAKGMTPRPGDPAPSFNLSSALHHVCGCTPALFESNQGLAGEAISLNHDQILDSHLILLRALIEQALGAGA